MLATLKEVLEKAEQGNYAVGAFNCTSLESGMAVKKKLLKQMGRTSP